MIVTVPKLFKIGQKLTEIWPKNRFFGGLGTFCANFTKMVLWVLSALTFSYIYINKKLGQLFGPAISSMSGMGVLGVMGIREERELFHPI